MVSVQEPAAQLRLHKQHWYNIKRHRAEEALGKIETHNISTITTLNTLAKFAGYNDWREFKHQVYQSRAHDQFLGAWKALFYGLF